MYRDADRKAAAWLETAAELKYKEHRKTYETRMWANAQRDGRPAEYRWRHLFNAAG